MKCGCKWKERRKKLFVPFVMILFNILISCCAAVAFNRYISDNEKEVHDVALQGVMESAAGMTKLLERYMFTQQDVIYNIADYINSVGLTEEETIVYLEHMKNIDGILMLINPDDYRGYVIKGDGSDNRERKEKAVGRDEVLKNACDDCMAGRAKKEFLITDVYQSLDTEEKSIAFYQPVVIEERTWVVFYTFSIKEIIRNVNGEQGRITEPGLLVDHTGEVLYYALEEDNDYPENYYDYLVQYYGEDESVSIRNEIESNASGSYVQKDEDGKEWTYIYYRLGDELDDSWIYLNRIDNSILQRENKLTVPLICLISFMTIPWLINVGVIVWQNQRLRKRQCVIEDKNKQLENANKAQTAFISNMSHEIRTPINAVLGMDEMIIRESTEEEIREYAYNIKNAGKTLLGIINDILDFTKIEAGKMDIIEQEYELSSAINDLINMIEVKVREKGLDFEVNMNPDIPQTLLGDELRIKQIILNILTNAVKYTERGSITFNLDYEKLDEKQIFLIVAIRDTGIGMKQEEMDKLTKPFERLDEKRNRTVEGTGLGMSIVTSLLAQMGSKLEVESTYGVGSRFFFRLKQNVVNWTPVGDLERKYKETKNDTEEQGALFHASKANILVVDDTSVNLTVVKGLLKRTGARVDLAESGKECLELCEKKHYHVILLDHRMPEMDGVETLHRLREMDGENKDTPVIALTANAVSGAAEYYMREGFQDFLSKPVSGNKLERVIAKYLPEEVLDTKDDLAVEIDRNAGVKASGSEEIYEQVCEEFAATAKKNMLEIETFYETGNIKDYTIKVHALKSAARLVGANGLSKEAEYLEQCGKEERIGDIHDKTAELLKHYEMVAAKFCATSAQEEKIQMEQKELREALIAIKEFCDAFDFEQVDAVMKQISVYAMPEDFVEDFEKLQVAIFDVDKDSIDRIIQEYLGGKENE